jgi:predicted outer membrane repeat protein
MHTQHSQYGATMLRTLIAALVLYAFAYSLGSTPLTHANNIVVNSKLDTADPSKCRLRDAILNANNNDQSGSTNCAAGTAGMDNISFAFAQCAVIACTITLNSALPQITEDLTINGATGGGHVTLHGANAFGVLTTNGPPVVSNPFMVVNLTNLTISSGNRSGGGGILSRNTNLSLTNITLSNNSASVGGGAIDHDTGPLTLQNVTLNDNHAGSGRGGAIALGNGNVTITASTFNRNTARHGGAIDTLFAVVTSTQTTFLGNVASDYGGAISADDVHGLNIGSGSQFIGNFAGSRGSAIFIDDSCCPLVSPTVKIDTTSFGFNRVLTGTSDTDGGALYKLGSSRLTLSNSTFSVNLSNKSGGALVLAGGPVTLTNVTVSDNAASVSGGGIYVASISRPSVVELDNVTISNNIADDNNNRDGDGGGIFLQAGAVNVQNSIIAGNFDTPHNSGSMIAPDCQGAFSSSGFNLIGRNDKCNGFINGSNGNKVGTALNPINPLLGPLVINGGSTPTQALLAGSPARDAGNPAAPGSGGNACAATDQRGVLRPIGSRCDMGAFEANVLLFLPFIRR